MEPLLPSDVKRRALLQGAFAGGAVLTTGCVGDEPGSGDAPARSPTGTDSPNPKKNDPTESDTAASDSTETGHSTEGERYSPTADDGTSRTSTQHEGYPRLVDRTFEIVSNGCGRGANEADANADGRTVTVTGTIDGSNTCYTAGLETVFLEESGSTLQVDVESYVSESENTRACGQCIVDISYESTFEFEGGRPNGVDIHHNDEPVARISF